MRCGVAKTVTRVGNAPPSHCCHGVGYLLARSVLYETLAIITAAYPSDVILVSHILSIFSVGISFIRFHHLQAVLCGCCLASC